MSPRATEPSERVEEILADREPRLLELPSTLAQGRYAVSRQAIIGVALVVAVAVAMLGGRLLLARDEAAPEPVAAEEQDGGATPFAASETTGAAAGGPAASEGAAAPGAAPAAPSGKVTVHVVGEVRRPGVVTLPGGSRVAEALDQAGGETSDADLTGVNLARPLVDGEQVLVPKPGEAPAPAAGPGAPAAPGVPAAPGAPAPPGAPTAPGDPAGAPVNLNTADLTVLETLPGVGPVLAQRIIDWRTEHGQFTAIEELGEVSGIGEKTYAQLAPKVTV